MIRRKMVFPKQKDPGFFILSDMKKYLKHLTKNFEVLSGG